MALASKSDNHDEGENLQTTQLADKMEASKESNIVDFEGPDDPDNPFNWPKSHKVMSIVTIAFLTFLS
jgi:N-methylhydantoinase B/oxoprolinase/acetone carboxylase alpha subunit